MENIFNKDTEKYLKDYIDDKQINKIKYKTYKENMLKILKEVIQCVENDDFEGVNIRVAGSYAGDGYGDDNNFINFGVIDSDVDSEKYSVDICQALGKLLSFKNQS